MGLNVRVFDEAGGTQATFGRKGDGPGEFQFLSRLVPASDSTIVAGSIFRLAEFRSDGSLVAEERPDWTAIALGDLNFEAAFPMADSAFLVMLIEGGESRADGRLNRNRLGYMIMGPGRRWTDTLGVFNGLEQMAYSRGGRVRSAIPSYPRATHHFVAGHVVVIGDNDRDSVVHYDARTRTRSLVFVGAPRTPVGSQVLKDARTEACNWTSAPDERRECEYGLTLLPDRETYPAFRALGADSMANIWVARYSDDSTVTSWDVFAADGRLAGRVGLPPDFRPTQIGYSYVLGIRQDSLGVQSVVEYTLDRK